MQVFRWFSLASVVCSAPTARSYLGRRVFAFALSVVAVGCASGGRDAPGPLPDASIRDSSVVDAALDSGPDAAPSDAPDGEAPDAGPDAVADAASDAIADAAVDAMIDAPGDATADAMVDAPVDAMVDAMVDAGCGSAADCSNGLACDGIERCVAGVCQPGTPLVCDDGIACTVDACIEPGMCNFMPDNTRCPVGQTCGATGCLATCPESPCRLAPAQCGCPTGQGCFLNGSLSRECRVAGPQGAGESCATAACRAGFECIDIAASGPSIPTCVRYCGNDIDCPGGLCFDLVDGMGAPLPGARVCTQPCNPARLSGCAPGANCDIFRESTGAMRLFTDCRAPVGTTTQGLPCLDSSDCAAGHTCIDPDGAGIRGNECLHYCEVGVSSVGCSIFDTCFGFATPLVVNGTEYGVCD
ncbi:MAG: hypothetical protein AAGF12_31620 [Myxococcota bacterium]